MPPQIPARYRWAVDLLDVRPDDRILEIGCGYGHAIGLICARLESGHLYAIDRSDRMVRAAIEKNRQHIDSGRAHILLRGLLDSEFPPESFDKTFLFNINAFWMDPVEELAEVRRVLKLKGEFFIFHLPPPEHDITEFVERFRLNLTNNGFDIISEVVKVLEGKEMCCVRSRVSHR